MATDMLSRRGTGHPATRCWRGRSPSFLTSCTLGHVVCRSRYARNLVLPRLKTLLCGFREQANYWIDQTRRKSEVVGNVERDLTLSHRDLTRHARPIVFDTIGHTQWHRRRQELWRGYGKNVRPKANDRKKRFHERTQGGPVEVGVVLGPATLRGNERNRANRRIQALGRDPRSCPSASGIFCAATPHCLVQNGPTFGGECSSDRRCISVIPSRRVVPKSIS
jgi:hypothetical protein